MEQKENPRCVLTSVIENELDIYIKWANGEIYSFVLFDDNGNVEDSCGGFYNIDDIKECLSDDWKNENLHEYLQY